jgi:hypothetical protein
MFTRETMGSGRHRVVRTKPRLLLALTIHHTFRGVYSGAKNKTAFQNKTVQRFPKNHQVGQVWVIDRSRFPLKNPDNPYSSSELSSLKRNRVT